MKLCFYTPFKPLLHARPSGDQVTASGIFDFLAGCGHRVLPVSSLRCRWIYWRPWQWPALLQERRRVARRFAGQGLDLWLTYHTYYKAPDLLGPPAAKKLALPYVVFQGIWSTKRRRRLKTLPGFYLNTRTLCAARHVFTNKKVDLHNLQRLLPAERITYIAPGLVPDEFNFDAQARQDLRRQWQVGDVPVILSAAMFRPDVKTEGLIWVIRTCGELRRRGHRFCLVIAGDGREKKRLQQLAARQPEATVRFVGQLDRREMARFYSAGDLFVFPGIRESLGMVFLEAQCCGLPVVAFDNSGTPAVIRDGETGFLIPMYDQSAFADAIAGLLANRQQRRQMGAAGRRYVRRRHDLRRNYRKMEKTLRSIAGQRT